MVGRRDGITFGRRHGFGSKPRRSRQQMQQQREEAQIITELVVPLK